jgi:hypothetical protein
VLVVIGSEGSLAQASAAILNALEGLPEPELVVCRFLPNAASQFLEARFV